jgi:hypothetical protein
VANEKLLFRDFFFVVVVLVAASLGDILYSYTKDSVPVWFRGLSLLACLYYVYVLIYGVSRFAELTEIHNPIGQEDLFDDLWFMGTAIAITLLAELAISLTETMEPRLTVSVSPAPRLGGRQ